MIDAESGHAVCGGARQRPRPLASNTKLFTTGTVLAASAPKADRDQGAEPTARSTDGVLHGSLYLRAAATRRSASPAFYDRYLGGVGTNLYALKATDRGGRDQAGHRPAVRRRRRLRPAARRRRLRLRDQPLNRAALRPRLQLRLQRLDLAAASPPTRRSSRRRSWPAALRGRGVAIRAEVGSARRRPGAAAARHRPLADDGRSSSAPTSTPTTSSPRCWSSCSAPLRRRRHHRGRRRGGRTLRPLPRHRRPRGRRLRPDPLRPRLARAGRRPAAVDARPGDRRRVHRRPRPRRQQRHRRRPHARHRRRRPLPDQDRHPDRGQQPLRLLLQPRRQDDGLLDPDGQRRRPHARPPTSRTGSPPPSPPTERQQRQQARFVEDLGARISPPWRASSRGSRRRRRSRSSSRPS